MQMKAVGFTTPGTADVLVDIEVEKPTAAGRDLLVQVQAISVNPVDYKIRTRRPSETNEPQIIGWDAVGEVVEVGDAVTNFKPGDMVWYAGAINRPGSNAEFQLVDERIVGHKPTNATNTEAAALPLTTLTAWEMLFDRLRVHEPIPGPASTVLIIGGAGGVGSIAIQLLRSRTDLNVIATASRPETKAWCEELGAHHVVDHSQPLAEQIEALEVDPPGYVFSTTHTEQYIDQIAEFIAPQGRFGLIDDPTELSIMPFKSKSVSIHWELMFTRSVFGTEDMGRQGEILSAAADLLDEGAIRSTATETLGLINAANLQTAHRQLETGTVRGKLVLEGF